MKGRSSVDRYKLEEVLQAAEEIESASSASLDSCGFSSEEERLAFIKAQARDIVDKVSLILGYCGR
jgi:hypothetical protein